MKKEKYDKNYLNFKKTCWLKENKILLKENHWFR